MGYMKNMHGVPVFPVSVAKQVAKDEMILTFQCLQDKQLCNT